MLPVTAVEEGVLLCRGSLYVEAAEGQTWGWYSPHQIPSLIVWLETGSQQEQQLAEELYTLYQPVLRLVAQPGQVCICNTHLPLSPMKLDPCFNILVW